MSVDAPWVVNGPGRPRLRATLRELWRFRELIAFFAGRDIKVRYKQAAFGALWAVLQPIAGAAALTLVFHRFGHLPSGGVPYIVSTLLAYTTWTYLASTVGTITNSFLANANLVTKVYFPRVAIPVAALVPGLTDLAGGYVMLALFMGIYGVAPGPALLTLPLWLLGLVACAYGAGLVLGTLNVQFRDVGQLVGLLMQVWFFVSPVAYPSTVVGGPVVWLYHVNPMAGLLDGFRWAVFDQRPPGAPCLLSLATGVVLVVAATRHYLRTERRFADII